MIRLTFLLLLIPNLANAAVGLDIQDIMQNLRDILTPTMILLLTISFVTGVGFVLKGLLLLRQFSMPLTQATRPGEIAGPLVYLVVGAVLIFIPTSTDVISNTFFNNPDSIFSGFGGNSFTVDLENIGQASVALLGYSPISVEGEWASLFDTLVLYIELIGFIAFLRGWFMVSHAGQPGVQPGSITKGVVHIVGGILAINFIPLVEAVHNTILG